MSAPATALALDERRLAFERALARIAHAGVVLHIVWVSFSLSGTQIGLGVAAGALLLARAAGARPFVKNDLIPPAFLLAAASAASVAIAWATGIAPAGLFRATLWKTVLAPVVVAWALELPVPGEAPDAPRRRATSALVLWSVAALVVAAVAAVQPWTGFDPAHAVGLRSVPVQVTAERARWPGHFHALGFYQWYIYLPLTLVPSAALAGGLALLAPLPRRTRGLLAAAAVGAAAASVLSLTRVAWVSLAVAGAALVAPAMKRARRIRLWAGASTAAAAVALLAVPGVRQRLATGWDLADNADRALIWRVCGEVFRDHPLGIGFGNFPSVAPPYFDRLAPSFLVRTGCHDAALSFLVDGGPLLLAAAVAWAVLLARAFLRARRDSDAFGRAAAAGGLAALAGAIANGLFHDPFHMSASGYAGGSAIALAWVLARPRSVTTAGTAAARSRT